MNLRLLIAVFGLTVLLNMTGVSVAEEKQVSAPPQQSLLSSPRSEDIAIVTQAVPIKMLADQLRFNLYEAIVGDISLCGQDAGCAAQAKEIKSWICASNICQGTDRTRQPLDCFEDVANDYSQNIKEKIGTSICAMIKAPSSATRKEFLSQIPLEEQDLIRPQAYLLALNESAESCQALLKKYVGPYGPKWQYRWYRAMSGCRILGKARTKEQEEKDYYTWIGVAKKYNCSKIKNFELKNACQAKKAASPRPPKETILASGQSEPFSTELLVEQLKLKSYEASKDLSLCQKDEKCLEGAKKFRSWRCIADVCGGKNPEKEPSSCFDESLAQLSAEDQSKFNAAICSYLKSPNNASRKEIMERTPGLTENDLVELEADYLALTESAGSCQNYIKNFVGAYGPQWNYQWYKALSGCKLLSGEGLRESEEGDFYTWIGMEQNFTCSQIENSEMRNACNAPGATTPIPTQTN